MSEPRDRAELDHLTYPVHCHVCPGKWSAEKEGLPGDTDQHPRYASRLIGSPAYGGLWHCPEHADQLVTDRRFGGDLRAECGCPVGEWTDEMPAPEQIERARRWKEARHASTQS